MFEIGHKYGHHKNHYRGGRLSKEQMAELAGLVPKSIEVWRKILEMPVTLKGASVQAETASKVMSKFVADLSELNGDLNLTGINIIDEFINSVKDRTTKGSTEQS